MNLSCSLYQAQKYFFALQKYFSDAGFLYVLTNPLWPTGILKIGKTKCITKRIQHYNGAQPVPVSVHLLFLCKNVTLIENELKEIFRQHKYGNHTEFLSIPTIILEETFQTKLVKDEEWSKAISANIVTFSPSFVPLQPSFQNQEETCETLLAMDFEFETSSLLQNEILPFFQVEKSPLLNYDMFGETNSLVVQGERNEKKQEKNVSSLPRGILFQKERNIILAYFQFRYFRKSKSFSITKLGFEQAIEQAQEWRKHEMFIAKESETINSKKRCHSSPANSKTKGVLFDGHHNGFLACVQRRRIKKRKFFSLKKYGEQAYEKACRWRKEQSEAF